MSKYFQEIPLTLHKSTPGVLNTVFSNTVNEKTTHNAYYLEGKIYTLLLMYDICHLHEQLYIYIQS